MSDVTTFPIINVQPNTSSPQVFYLADGRAIFVCPSTPEGNVLANIGSMALTKDKGECYLKTTDNSNTGWKIVNYLLSNNTVVGSPEGVVIANPGTVIINTTGDIYIKVTGTGNTGWKQIFTSSSGANTFLSNLTSLVAVNQHLYPGTDATFDLGNPSGGPGNLRWRKLSLSNGVSPVIDINAGVITMTDLGSGNFNFQIAGNDVVRFDGTPRVRIGNSILAFGSDLTAAGQTTGLDWGADSVVRPNNGSHTFGGTFAAIPNRPASIGANQNDYNPNTSNQGRSYYQLLTSSVAVNITGLTFGTVSAFQIDGEMHEIWNIGTNNITLTNQDAASNAVNRFLNSTAANIVLAGAQGAKLFYDNTTQRWRVTKFN